MKILLLGKNGQVGFELHRALSVFGEIVAPDRDKLDLSDEQAVSRYLIATKPELIVNAAAWTAVDAAESQQDEANQLNSNLPRQLAEYAAANHLRLIHFSTDYVYPGSGESAWHENRSTAPISTYGKSKLAGDQAIEQSGADFLIFRTSWVYSARRNNFMKTMLKLAESKTELDIVVDQIGAPTPARMIAQLTVLAIQKRLEQGVYHLAPHGETSWHGFAEAIFLLAGYEMKLHPIATSEYPTPARRPLNSRLDVSKLEQALNIRLPDWQSQLALTLTETLEQT